MGKAKKHMNKMTALFFVMISMSAIAQSDTLVYEADSVKAIGQFRDGLKIGEWKWFSWNGKIQSSGEYIDDIPVNTWTNWNRDGSIMAIVSYDSTGAKHGKEIVYNYRVPETIEVTNRHGIHDGPATWRHLDGYVIIDGLYSENMKTGTWTWYWPNGNIQARGIMNDDEIEGIWFYYLENGSIENSGRFDKGLKTGEWIFYHANGKVRMKGSYDTDLQKGKWIQYDDNGKRQKVLNMIDGEER